MNLDNKDLEEVVQRYVLGQLSSTDTEAFEEYFLSRPDVIEMVETVQNIHVGMEMAERNAATRHSPAPRPGKPAWVQWLSDWFAVPVPAFAVVLMALVIVPPALQGLRTESGPTAMQLVNFSTDTTRSAGQAVTVDLSQTTGNAALLIKLKSVDFARYKLKLIADGEDDPMWISDPFQVSALRDHLVVLPDTIRPVKARIEVVGLSDPGGETPVEFCHYSETCR